MPLEPVKRISGEFRDAWTAELRPEIATYLASVEESRRDELLRELVHVDLECRVRVGETPGANDYEQFGAVGVSTAARWLADAFADGFDIDATHSASSRVSASARTRVASDTYRKAPRKAPKTIGRYRLIERLGRGGMGTVWVAEQEKPVKRRVALKLIRGDLDSEGALARFDAERQAIALMNHQNIARILDAGKTDDGSPYFVMELVDGTRLDRYCDDNQLSIRERLELMISVCRAIQHAHQKGIIHRDLKHSNVLIADHDGRPTPKVIDFGLAKALEHRERLTDETMITELGEVVGTLRYMSPEQAQGSDVDTRTDIYALGVMLYKLLAGSTPIRSDATGRESLVHVLDQIREEDPPRPSIRLESSADQSAEICAQRGAKLEKLQQVLKGDLDWIVMKALEKDRSRRYETANGLARDLERFLNDDEVAARPPSNFYRVQKFVKRHRGLVISLVAATLLLVAGVIGTSAGLIWAIHERDRANDRTTLAREEATRARRAEKQAIDAETQTRELQVTAEARLYAIRMKSAWSDWQMGNAQSAWEMLSRADTGAWESRFLHNEFQSARQVLYGHSMQVVSVDTSSDDRYIATAALDHTVLLRDVDGLKVGTRYLTAGAPTCVRFSPDARLLACADRANCITVWHLDGSEEPRVLGPYPRDIQSIAFAGDTLVLGESDSDSYRDGLSWRTKDRADPRVLVVSAVDGTIVESLTGHQKSVTDVVCGPAAKMILSASQDGAIRIWSRTEDGSRTSRVLSGHSGSVSALALSANGETLVSGGADRTVRIWKLASGETLRTLVGHAETVNSVALSPDGRQIVTGSSDGSARIWSVAGGEPRVCRGHFGAVNDVRFSRDGQVIVSVSDDKTARVWEVAGQKGTLESRPHQSLVWDSSFSADGATLVTCAEDGLIVRMDAATGVVTGQDRENEAVLSVACSPVDASFATGGADNRLTIRRLSDGMVLRSVDAHDDFIWDVSFSPDGSRVVSASSDRTVRIWKADDLTLVHEIKAHTGELASARYSPCGEFLVTASDDRTVRLWDAEFKHLHTFIGHRNTVWKAVFSPSSDLIASSSYDGELIIWDVARRRRVRTVQAHSDQIAGLAFSPDGRRVITASDDASIRVWDFDNGIDVFVLRDRNDSQIVTVAFSADGSRMVSGNGSGWVTVRAAAAESSPRPFLPLHAVRLCTAGLSTVADPNANHSDFQRELTNAVRCCEHYPSYQAWTIRGITEYRLGHYDQAMVSLLEAQRLEPVEYGEPDVRPFIEGYLAIVALKTDQPELAVSTRNIFDEKRSTGLWREDEQVVRLADEVEAAFVH